MLENTRSKANHHHQVASSSVPNFHYTQSTTQPQPNPITTNSTHKQITPQQLNPSHQNTAIQNRNKDHQYHSQYQTILPLIQTANKLMKSSPFNYQSTYKRYYTEPDVAQSEYYNRINCGKFYGLGRLGNSGDQQYRKFNKFEGRTMYGDSYGSLISGKDRTKGQIQRICKPIDYSHYYGKQRSQKRTTSQRIGPMVPWLERQTEYNKNYTNPQQKQRSIFKVSREQRDKKSKSNFQYVQINNNRKYKNQTNDQLMGKYYLSLKDTRK